MATKKRSKKAVPSRAKKRARPGWEMVQVTRGLYRLIGPLAHQKNRKKQLCIAIGGPRLKAVVDALNDMGVEI